MRAIESSNDGWQTTTYLCPHCWAELWVVNAGDRFAASGTCWVCRATVEVKATVARGIRVVGADIVKP